MAPHRPSGEEPRAAMTAPAGRRGAPLLAALRALLCGGALASPPALAQDAAAPPAVFYWSVWAGTDGATHISRCAMTGFALRAFAPPAAPEWTRPLPEEVTGITFAVQPVGWVGEWHENPKPQWIVPISGRWFVETTDGGRVVMGPGEVSFGGDQGARASTPSGPGWPSLRHGGQPATGAEGEPADGGR